MDIRILRYFDTVARLGNVTVAANALHIAQPALSKQLRVLEREVGFRLFTRMPHGVALTPEGTRFWEFICPVLEEFSRVEQEIEAWRRGWVSSVAVGYVPSVRFRLHRILVDIFAEQARVPLTLHEATSMEMFKLLEDRKLDLAVTRMPVMGDRLQFTMVDDDAIGVVVARRHPWVAERKKLDWSNLNGQNLVVITSSLAHSGFLHVLESLQAEGVRPGEIVQVNAFASMMHLIAVAACNQQWWVGLAPRTSASLGGSSVCYLPFRVAPVGVPLAVVWRHGEQRSLVLKVRDRLIASWRTGQGRPGGQHVEIGAPVSRNPGDDGGVGQGPIASSRDSNLVSCEPPPAPVAAGFLNGSNQSQM